MNTEMAGKELSATQQKMLEEETRKERIRRERSERAKRDLEGKGGRPKGSKNKLTLLREVVLAKAENMVLDDWTDVVQTTLNMAKAGDSTCLKILWDRVIPSKRAIDSSKDGIDKMNITINVEGLEVKAVMGEKSKEPIEDAEYEEVTVESDG